MDYQQLRRLIPATNDMVYLNTGWAGPSPQPVLERIHQVMEDAARLGPASPDWLVKTKEIEHEARAEVAALIKAPPEQVLLTHGTTEGMNIVLHGLAWQPGDELVTCDLEHPAIQVPLELLQEQRGVVGKVVHIPADASANEIVSRIRSALGPRTKVVALSHIQYSCGLRMPIAEIGEAVHEAGALLLVDGAQTAGHIALDMGALGADFYSISGQKWLLGPEGTGAFYIATGAATHLRPLLELPEPASEGSAALQPYSLTSQNTALLAGLTQAVQIARALDAIQTEQRALDLAQRFQQAIARIPGCALTGPRDLDVSSGLTSVAMEGFEPQALVDTLWKRHRIAARAVGYQAAVRFSTAVFNTEEEVDSTARAIAQIVGEYPS